MIWKFGVINKDEDIFCQEITEQSNIHKIKLEYKTLLKATKN